MTRTKIQVNIKQAPLDCGKHEWEATGVMLKIYHFSLYQRSKRSEA